MDKKLYDFFVNKCHKKYRHPIDLDLKTEYSKKGLSPIDRMSDRFEKMCKAQTPHIFENEQIVFMRTTENLPEIFTEEEWTDIKKKHFIHELGFMSNLSPNYYGTIKVGLVEKRKTADIYGQRAIDNIIMLSDKYLKEAKKIGRDDIVEILTQVP